MDDQFLLEKIAEGDEESFVCLLEKYELRVFRYFTRCFNDSCTAEDLTQTVFVIVLEQIHNHCQCFSHYLFKICKNLALKEFRRRRNNKFNSQMPAEYMESPSISLEKKESDLLFNKAVADLPFIERQVVLLKFMENFSLKEISGILDIPCNTVKSHIHRAKEHLRKYLKDYYE